MPVDDAEKRKAALEAASGLAGIPLPDGEIDAGDRAQLLGRYRGIPAATPLADWLPHRARDTTRTMTATTQRAVGARDTTRQFSAASLHWPGAD